MVSSHTGLSASPTAGNIYWTPVTWCCPAPPAIQFEFPPYPRIFFHLTGFSYLRSKSNKSLVRCCGWWDTTGILFSTKSCSRKPYGLARYGTEVSLDSVTSFGTSSWHPPLNALGYFNSYAASRHGWLDILFHVFVPPIWRFSTWCFKILNLAIFDHM